MKLAEAMNTTMRSDGDTQKPLAECFSFRCDRLQNGDILLCTDPDEKLGKAIRIATGGAFSHTAHLHDRAALHRSGSAHHRRILARRTVARAPCRRQLLRLKRSVSSLMLTPSPKPRPTLAQEFQIGRYDVLGAAASVFGGLPDRQGVFCSFIVAAAYAKAGLNIANKPPRRHDAGRH